MTPTSTAQRVARLIPHTSAHQRESRDSLGIGKLLEGQMRAVIDIIKERGLLKEPGPTPTGDRGIVIAGGGKYLSWAWVNAKWTRMLGVNLPLQVWYLGEVEMPQRVRKHFTDLDVELVDAFKVREKYWHRMLKGWSLKQYAAMRAPWQTVLSLDADAFLIRDPAWVLDDPQFIETGAFFCADVNKCRTSNWAYMHFNVPIPEKEMESGYFAWDRTLAWEGIKFTHWIAEHSEVFDRLIWGDKDRPYLGFQTTNTPYLFADEPQWVGSGIRHFWRGEAIVNHGMSWKRGEHPAPSPVLPRLFEEWRALTS